jgi:hypothetical protein
MEIEITVGYASNSVELDDEDILSAISPSDIMEFLSVCSVFTDYVEELVEERESASLKNLSLAELFAEIERRVNL